jgi:hypothetical protein
VRENPKARCRERERERERGERRKRKVLLVGGILIGCFPLYLI